VRVVLSGGPTSPGYAAGRLVFHTSRCAVPHRRRTRVGV